MIIILHYSDDTELQNVALKIKDIIDFEKVKIQSLPFDNADNELLFEGNYILFLANNHLHIDSSTSNKLIDIPKNYIDYIVPKGFQSNLTISEAVHYYDPFQSLSEIVAFALELIKTKKASNNT